MYEISKEFKFSASHSVYSQKLREGWATNLYPKCRRLPGHGHNYKLKIFLKSEGLDASQMVTDFGHLGWFKNFIDRCFDHKLIIGIGDPAFKMLFERLGILKNDAFGLKDLDYRFSLDTINDNYDYTRYENLKCVQLAKIKSLKFATFNEFSCSSKLPEADFYQRLFDGIAFLSSSPTSENLSCFFFHFISRKLNGLGVKCSKVSISESDTSSAEYRRGG